LPAAPQLLSAEVRAFGTCFCEMVQLTGNDQRACQTQPTPAGTVASGWCYVDPAQTNDMSECAIVATCPASDRRIIRFVTPDSEPRAGPWP